MVCGVLPTFLQQCSDAAAEQAYADDENGQEEDSLLVGSGRCVDGKEGLRVACWGFGKADRKGRQGIDLQESSPGEQLENSRCRRRTDVQLELVAAVASCEAAVV